MFTSIALLALIGLIMLLVVEVRTAIETDARNARAQARGEAIEAALRATKFDAFVTAFCHDAECDPDYEDRYEPVDTEHDAHIRLIHNMHFDGMERLIAVNDALYEKGLMGAGTRSSLDLVRLLDSPVSRDTLVDLLECIERDEQSLLIGRSSMAPYCNDFAAVGGFIARLPGACSWADVQPVEVRSGDELLSAFTMIAPMKARDVYEWANDVLNCPEWGGYAADLLVNGEWIGSTEL